MYEELPDLAVISARSLLEFTLSKHNFSMPEAVSVFIDRKNLDDVIDVHLSIIETYQDDFAKYTRDSQLSKIQNVFQYVPHFNLSKRQGKLTK